MKPTKNRSARLSSLVEDSGIIPEDAPFRARLQMLFAQIEKEFELLYLENLSLQEKIDSCTNKDSIVSCSTGAAGCGITTAASAITLVATAHDDGDAIAVNNKGFKAKVPSSGGGKVKASHKIKAQTSRLVSSFKAQSVVSTVVREFCGHKDGVWQVAAKVGQPIIGTASADHTACIWGIESGRCLLQYQGHAGSVNSIKFHQNRDLVLTGSGDGTAHIWQAAVNWDLSRKGHSSEEELDDSEEQVEDREIV